VSRHQIGIFEFDFDGFSILGQARTEC